MHRSGFASLLALVVLVVASTMVAGMLATARSSTLAGMVASRRLVADTLLGDGERFACAWLDQHGSHVVLPPAGGGLLIVDHQWQDHTGRSCRLAIVLHDVLASLPPAALVAGHPLRMALASPGSGPVMHSDPSAVPAADLLARVDLPSTWSRLPTGIPTDRPLGSTIDWMAIAPQPLLAVWFNPDNPGAINANTAPASILRIAAAPPLDIETLLTQRRSGTRWDGPAQGGPTGLQIVPASSRWDLLILADVGGHQAVRWAVGDGVGGHMTIIRRHDVTPASTSAPAW